MEVKTTIKVKGKEYHLCEPSFDVYALAMQEYITGTGKVNLVGAGKIVFDACYLNNAEKLDEIQNDVPLYANICMQAAQLVEFFEGEVKKK